MFKRLLKWLKRLVIAAVCLAVIGWLAGTWLLNRWAAKPPPLPANTSIMTLQPETRDGRTWLGKSWVGQRDGLTVIYLKGAPFDLGYANGTLLQPQIHTLENEFLKMVHGYVPNDFILRTLKNYVIYRNRHLSDFVPLDYRTEIYGATLACPDIHPEYGAYYNRVLNYHAAQDVSYMMIDNPLVTKAGCTGFGAWGAATENGHLITGRNFDWEAAEVFSTNRVVEMCEPDDGIPFISLSWAGMAGVVSGMNRAGVSVTINGAPSGLPDQTATPVAIIARDVMQHAHNLKEAVAIASNAQVFVSTMWLVGSRADGKFIVIEKTPAATHVREPDADTIVCANHFQTAGFKDSDRNKEYMSDATSISRDTRMTELLKDSHGHIDISRAADILRDRKLPGSAFPGNGHRATLNALIATHATIMDLTDGIFWAASPPNQLGKFVPFDVNDFNHELPEKTVAADPMLASGEYDRARLARQDLANGQRALKDHQAKAAFALATNAEALNPGFYQNAALKGRALLEWGRPAEAAVALQNALNEHPAFLKEKQDLEALLRKAGGTN